MYAEGGGLVRFAPLSRQLDNSISAVEKPFEDYIYHCKVHPQVFKGSTMKLVTLEKFEEDLEDDHDVKSFYEEEGSINDEFNVSSQNKKKRQSHHLLKIQRLLQNKEILPLQMQASEREGLMTNRIPENNGKNDSDE